MSAEDFPSNYRPHVSPLFLFFIHARWVFKGDYIVDSHRHTRQVAGDRPVQTLIGSLSQTWRLGLVYN